MTDTQKQNIIYMKNAGYGNTFIAQNLGISVNTIKSFLRRCDFANSNASEEQKPIDTYFQCKQCGTWMPQIHTSKKRLFCSAGCRSGWWNQHRAVPGRKSFHEHICAYCKKPFVSNRPDQKYCSPSCYQKDRFGKESTHDKGTV